jgi:hypothetical protein
VNKSFTVGLSNPTGGAILGTSTRTVTIMSTSAQVAAEVLSSTGAASSLTTAEAQPVVAAAEQQWLAAGVAPGALRRRHLRDHDEPAAQAA